MNIVSEFNNPAFPNYRQLQSDFYNWIGSLPDQPIELTLRYSIVDAVPYSYRYRKLDKPLIRGGVPNVAVIVEVYDVLRQKIVNEFVAGCNKLDHATWGQTAEKAILDGLLMSELASVQTDEMVRLFQFSLFNVEKFLAENKNLSDEATWRFISVEVGLATFIECVQHMLAEGLMTADIEDASFMLIVDIMEAQSKVWEDDSL